MRNAPASWCLSACGGVSGCLCVQDGFWPLQSTYTPHSDSSLIFMQYVLFVRVSSLDIKN